MLGIIFFFILAERSGVCLAAQDNDIFDRKAGIGGDFLVGQLATGKHSLSYFTGTTFNLRVDIVREFFKETSSQDVMIPFLVKHFLVSLEFFLGKLRHF